MSGADDYDLPAMLRREAEHHITWRMPLSILLRTAADEIDLLREALVKRAAVENMVA